jgi:hypothetical protein
MRIYTIRILRDLALSAAALNLAIYDVTVRTTRLFDRDHAAPRR